MHCLLTAANSIKQQFNTTFHFDADADDAVSLVLSKQEMEDMSEKFRYDLGLAENDPLDALRVKIDGVDVFTPRDITGLEPSCLQYLVAEGSDEWSAMSVPLDLNDDKWAILRNDRHTPERQKVTYLEECWHIMLGDRKSVV